MLTALDPKTPADYICQDDTENSTVFLLSGLSGRDKIRVMAQARITGDRIVYSPDCIDEALRLGLHGWRNLHDKSGQEVKFSGNLARDLEHLDSRIIMELFEEILERSGLGVNLKKKSSLPAP